MLRPLIAPPLCDQNVAVELKAEGDMLSRRQREKELMLRQYRIADQQVRGLYVNVDGTASRTSM